jgi:hypothetical protein
MAGAAFYVLMGRGLPTSVKGLHVVTGGAEIRVRGKFHGTNHKDEEKSCGGKEYNSPFLFFGHLFEFQHRFKYLFHHLFEIHFG